MSNEIPQDVYNFLYQHRKKKPEIHKSDFTAEIAAVIWDVSLEHARRLLNTMAREGKIDKFKVGRRCFYRKINPDNDLTNIEKPV